MTHKREQTLQWNIPVVVADHFTVYVSEETVVLEPDLGSTCSINAPFAGVFLLKVECDFRDNPRYNEILPYTIKVNGVYGGARQIYLKNNMIAYVAKWEGTGCYLCHYDTDEQKIYIV